MALVSKRHIQSRLLLLLLLLIGVMLIVLYYDFSLRYTSLSLWPKQQWEQRQIQDHLAVWDLRIGRGTGSEQTEETERDQKLSLASLGVLSSMDATGWHSRDCDRSRKLRQASFLTPAGNLSVYIYDSASEDDTFTKQALRGSLFFEHKEMTQFLSLSGNLPLIDIGANIGLVALQAALQGRQVVAIEPIPENALRLCRAVCDFGYEGLIHVIQNAVSSTEGNVTLAMDRPVGRARYKVTRSTHSGYGATRVFAMRLDRLLRLLPFHRAAVKIDVESHEGHVLAGAERLFEELDIPLLWMEWEHLSLLSDHGAAFTSQWLHRHGLVPFNLMTGLPLTDMNVSWPRTVLWRKVY